jgi:anti-sigma-K factor RskA
MDNSLDELEIELQALQPRRAAPRWLQQVDRELAAELPASERPRFTTATNLSSWKWLGWRTAGLAATMALAVTMGLISFKQSQPTPPPVVASNSTPIQPVTVYEPTKATNVLYDLKDEGEVMVDGAAPARQVRARFVDTYTWKNPRNNASIKWTVPRDEIRVVPASFNPN